VEQQEYLLEKDDAYFIPPHMEHTISAINKTKYDYIVLCMNNNIQKYSNNSLCKYVFKDKIVGMTILNMIQEYKYGNNKDYFENMVLNFLGEYIEIDCSYKKQTSNRIILLTVDFIKDNLNETFDLQKLSKYANISKYHLLRLFKNQMGVTPYQFYIQEKIKQIRKGLLKQQPISDLVFNFNFSDESHLCNTFKKHIGITPMQFKDSYKNFD
jgi:AraC-like DNA-binding protein